jgi:hypothetical protein
VTAAVTVAVMDSFDLAAAHDHSLRVALLQPPLFHRVGKLRLAVM